MYKIVRPDLRSLSFPSSNFDEEYRGEEGRTRQCMSYGEAASAITIDINIGHLSKKFYRQFDADILTWLPYDEEQWADLPIQILIWNRLFGRDGGYNLQFLYLALHPPS